MSMPQRFGLLKIESGHMYRTIVSSLTGLVGIFLLIGGAWLAIIGGSWFFVLLGAALCSSAFLLFKRRSEGLALYGAIILVTFVWSVYEVGFDWWALSARGSLLVVIGLLLLLPQMVHSLIGRRSTGRAMVRRVQFSPAHWQLPCSAEFIQCS